MMTGSQYGEPWIHCGSHCDNNRGLPIMRCFGKLHSIRPDLIERAVVCVNACAGVPTDDLVSGKARVITNIPTREQAEAEYLLKKLERMEDICCRAIDKAFEIGTDHPKI